MREILFRGKRLNNEWVFGDIHFVDNNTEICHGYCGTGVDRKTVGQFTGLLDKDGNRIFEGDIVLYRNESVGVVSFADGAFGVRFGDGTSAMFLCFAADDSVVIGNIHDDEELCKVYNLFIMCS